MDDLPPKDVVRADVPRPPEWPSVGGYLSWWLWPRDGEVGTSPQASGHKAGHTAENAAQEILDRCSGGQADLDLGLQLDDESGDLDQPQAQAVELGNAPGRALGHEPAQ